MLGVRRRKTKLTQEQIKLVRKLYEERVKYSLIGLAQTFGVGKSTIHEIVTKKAPYDFE